MRKKSQPYFHVNVVINAALRTLEILLCVLRERFVLMRLDQWS